MTAGVQCVWFKRDLRLLDHEPLMRARERGPLLLVYVIEPEVWAAPDADALHWQFVREALSDLGRRVASRGGCLRVERGEAVEVFSRLHMAFGIETIWSHEETGNAVTYRRDVRLARWARSMNVDWVECPQFGVVRGLKDRDAWARQWEARMGRVIVDLPERLDCAGDMLDTEVVLPSAEDMDLASSERAVDLEGGEQCGHAVLEGFIAERGHRYHREMSSPVTAFSSCSRLSPYLAWGCISMRTVVQRVRCGAELKEMPKVAARAFLSRCHWHCHFIQKLESEPAIEFHAFNRACDDLRERGRHADRLEAWQAGRTGYPFVDACMRALKARGWINFRMRAMLVSFASYHLWLDWRDFKDWLACQFIDYEPGIHISQVQMQSGLTGINTLRIYNPIKQGHDHDPGGDFIREWVPELSRLDTESIHEPWILPEARQSTFGCRLGTDYPLPIVDHKEAVKHARAQFAALRHRDDYWAASKVVLERHGSRRGARGRERPKRTKNPPDGQLEMNL